MKRLTSQKESMLWALSVLLMIAGAALLWLALWPNRPAVARLPVGMATQPLAEPAATAAPPPVRLVAPSPLPTSLEQGLAGWLAEQPGGQWVTDTLAADLWLTTEPNGEALIERFYVPVARFATLTPDISPPELLAMWLGGPGPGQLPLAVDSETAAALRLLWGEPAQVEVLPDAAAVAAALELNPGRLGILPFDQLLPQVQALSIDGNDPTDNQFLPNEYPLVLRFYLGYAPEAAEMAESLRVYLADSGLRSNRDPSKLTVLAMTGVTAMARVTALRMEQQGYDYPAQAVGPQLAAADLTHISNEIPFVADCQVDASENNLTLCSKPEYLAALRGVGVDLVGLTGNHLSDFGSEASLASLQFYKEQNLPTYGGGSNLQAALEPLLIEHNGNRLVFLGANSYGPEVAWAAADWPGAAPYSLETISQTIAAARRDLQADLALVDLQWEESYDTLPIASQREGMRQVSAAGADIVTGVQSHVPQAVEFGEGGLILYGLGNLFFDQMWSLETRQGLIPRHTIYAGRHLSTKLLVTVLEDYAQPRWATDAERRAVLRRVFTASGW